MTRIRGIRTIRLAQGMLQDFKRWNDFTEMINGNQLTVNTEKLVTINGPEAPTEDISRKIDALLVERFGADAFRWRWELNQGGPGVIYFFVPNN